MNKIFVILPGYNEEENIGPLMDAWLNEAEKLEKAGYQLLLTPVDDCSKDNTKAIMLRFEQEHENVKALIHEVNKGLGGGVQTGLSYFHDHAGKGDFALIMDADNTHDPKFVYSMIELAKAQSLDCVIASRYRKSSRIVGVPAFRNFLSFGARLYYTAVLGVKNVRDYTCGYRIYSYAIIDKAFAVYGDKFVSERSFACMMEVLYKLYCIGARFGEVPFELRYDYKLGESKMRIGSTVSSSLKTAMKLRLHTKKSKD